MEVISEMLDRYGWGMASEVSMPPEHGTTPAGRALFFAGVTDEILDTALTGMLAGLYPWIFALHAELSCVLLSMLESVYDRRESRAPGATVLVWCQVEHGSGRVSLSIETSEGMISGGREFVPAAHRY